MVHFDGNSFVNRVMGCTIVLNFKTAIFSMKHIIDGNCSVYSLHRAASRAQVFDPKVVL